jgi:hypothetical protein
MQQAQRVCVHKTLHLLQHRAQGNLLQITCAAVHEPRGRGALDL